ncbi:MAG: flotillin domain-containing protein, partial [Pseudomonadota bacterium]
DIAIAEKSREKSEADAEADRARAIAAAAAEEVISARETAAAARDKEIELIEARKAAEQKAIAVTVAAEAEKKASLDQAEALRIAAEGRANKEKIEAEASAEAEKLRAAALAATYEVDAAGKRAVNEASNVLSAEQIAMQVKMALIEAMPEIIAQSVKPIENIDGIKILQIDGLGGAGVAGGGDEATGARPTQGGVADQAVNAALRYRSQAPLIDALMKELGIEGGDLDGLASPLMANGAAEMSNGKATE